MSDKEYTITLSQGQYLLQLSAGAQIPEKLGDQTFTPTDRAIIQHMIAGLFAALKTYSPFVQEYEPGKNTRLLFGPKDSWRELAPGSGQWVLKNPEEVIKVRLAKDAVNAAAWCGFIALVPRAADKQQGHDGVTVASPLAAAETVWPLLKILGKEQGIRESLGMRKFEHKKHAWNDDPAPGEVKEELFADTEKK